MNLYDFNLTHEQQELAKKIHQESIVIDLLFQGPVGTYSITEELEQELLEIAKAKYPNDEVMQASYSNDVFLKWTIDGKLSDLYEECWMESGMTCACRQISVSDKDSLMRSIVSVQNEFDNKPWLKKVRTGKEIIDAHKNGYKAGIVTSQESIGYGKDLSLLEMAYDFGLRIQQLSYNNHNFIGAGCMEPNDAGVSVFGVKFIEKCNELGIIVDTGHCGKQTTLDACKYSSKPVIATHTGAENVFMHNRCKSDEEMIAIANTGGVVGIFAMPWFIAKDPLNTTIEDFLDHIDYVVNLVGVDHVGIGTDWPMTQTKWSALIFKKYVAHTIGFKPGDGPSTEYIHGIKDYRDFPNITAGLLSRGYSEQDIKKVIGGNWLRVIDEVCK